MKLINIIPVHLFLHCTYATVLPKDDNPCCPGVVDSKPPRDVPDNGIEWTRCNLGIPEYKKYEKNKAFECGTLEVPLDYTGKHTNTTILNLIKLKADKKATEKSPKGSIIVNFGGPGTSGVETMLSLQKALDVFGGVNVDDIRGFFDLQHDIISFDPRGTGKTMVPPVDEGILTEMSEELIYTVQNSSHTLTQDLLSDGLDYISTYTELFVTRDKEYREFRGTAFVARDIAAIATALGEGDRINYWGISYGTVLGQVLAGMFPDRIERMLLDGNLLADDYVKNLGADSFKDAENALYHFYDECMAATDNECHSANKLPEDRDDFLKVLDRVFMVCTGVGGGLGRPKSLSLTLWLLLSLYTPFPGYLQLDHLIDTALEGNRSMCPQQSNPVANMTTPWSPLSEVAHLAIMCSDATFRIGTNEEGVSLYEDGQAEKKPFFLAMLAARVACTRWNTHAAEGINLTSLSKVKTKNPILLVNGKYDPVTPLDHARKISARFPGSQVLVHEGVGHSILAHGSSCILAKVAEYFNTGKVPPEEITCKPDLSAFEYVAEMLERMEEMDGPAGKRKIPVLLWVVLGFLGLVCVCLVFLLCRSR